MSPTHLNVPSETRSEPQTALEWRASDFAERPATRDWVVGNLVDVLTYLLDGSTCRHVLLDKYLGEGGESPCDEAAPDRWCDNCCRRRRMQPWAHMPLHES